MNFILDGGSEYIALRRSNTNFNTKTSIFQGRVSKVQMSFLSKVCTKIFVHSYVANYHVIYICPVHLVIFRGGGCLTSVTICNMLYVCVHFCIQIFSLASKKGFCSTWPGLYSPPRLVTGPLKKNFFAASLTGMNYFIFYAAVVDTERCNFNYYMHHILTSCWWEGK